MSADPLTLECKGCHDAAARSANTGAVVACRACGERWGEEPSPSSCGGCGEARAYLEHQHHAAPQRGPRTRGEGATWPAGPTSDRGAVRCQDCGEFVTMSPAGSARHVDRERDRSERSESVARRGRLLRDMDHLCRWSAELEARSREPSPVIGDGNKGGGAKREAREKSAKVQGDHHALARAIGLRARLDAIGREHEGAGAYAVLNWLAFECPAYRRKHLAAAVGERFVKRPAEARRMAQLVEVERRKSIPPVKDPDVHRAAALAAYSAEVADAREERDAALTALRAEPSSSGRSFAYEQARVRVEAVRASRDAALARAEREIRDAEDRYTPEQAAAAVKRCEKVPSADEVKRRGAELLTAAEACWFASGGTCGGG